MSNVRSGGSKQERADSGSDFDVLVAGAGVTAAVMAALLVECRLAPAARVAIVAGRPLHAAQSALPESEWDLRVFALSRASQRLLDICGAWRLLQAPKCFAYERMCVWDSRSKPLGRGSLHFDCAELGEPNLGFIVEGRDLLSCCRRAAAAAGIALLEAAPVGVTLGEAQVRIRLDDGRELSSRLLIAADGAGSPTRTLLGIETAGHEYFQDALVAHVRTTESHRNTAWQRFLSTGPLALLPLPDGRSSIVWSVERAQARRLRSLDPAAFGAALTNASGGALGSCELTTPVAVFPLMLQYAVDYVRPRAALVGEAAHAVHPLAGQGLNLGLLDCASLIDVLRGGPHGIADDGGDPLRRGASESFGDHRLLRRYERLRRSENLLAVTATDGLERLFSSDNPMLSLLRSAGLGAVDHMPFLKRRLAARALGLRGEVPAFLRTVTADRPLPRR